MANEASDESVQALIDAVVSRYDIPQRWYALKAEILGVDRLRDFDRMASVTAGGSAEIGWAEGTRIVRDAYASFSDELAGIVGRFIDERWIDAPVRPGKRGGAFCAYGVPEHHPYVLLNWTSTARDVSTLAHELGHGVHGYLAREQGIFHQSTPLTLAETASVFGGDGHQQPAARRARRPRGSLLAALGDAGGFDRDRLPSGRDEPVRALLPHPSPRGGRTLGRPVRRVLGSEPGGDARRRGRGHRGLSNLVELCTALHRHPWLCVRLRLRPVVGPVGVRPLPRGR